MSNEFARINNANPTNWTFPLSTAPINLHFIGDISRDLALRLDPKWTKEEYLEWAKAWKTWYKKLSLASRTSKKYRKPSNIASVKTQKTLSEEEVGRIAYLRYSDVKGLKDEASFLLHLRHLSKVLAHAAFLRDTRRVNE